MTGTTEMPALPPPPGAAAEPKKLRRSREGRWVTGVCAGLAEYFGLHPAIYRIIFAALALAGGTGILLYAAAALVIPAAGSDESVAAGALREHRGRPWLVIGLALLALAAIAILTEDGIFWPLSGGAWLLALIAGLIVWYDVVKRDGRSGGTGGSAAASEVGAGPGAPVAAPDPRGRSWFWPGAGALIAVVGLLSLLQAADVMDIDWRFILPIGFIVAGGFFALVSRFRGMAALGFLAMALTVGTAGGFAAAALPWGGGIGDRSERPVAAADLDDRYELSFGSLEVDLSDLAVPRGETRVEASVTMGQLEVDLPPDVAVRVIGRAQGGTIDVLGREEDGWEVRERVVDPDFARAERRLVIDAQVGLGELEIRRSR